MTAKLSNRIIDLLAMISERGLTKFVAGNHAFQTLGRIFETGTSLPDGIREPEEDTRFCAEILVNPVNWGLMSNEAWLDFCIAWSER